MNEEHTVVCDCEIEERSKLEELTEKAGSLPSSVMAVEEMPAELLGKIEMNGPVQLSPEEKAAWEKKEAARKLRNSRKNAKRELLSHAKSKRERKFIKKILGIRMMGI